MRKISITLALLLSAFVLAGCESDSAAENAAEAVDRAADEVRDTAEEVRDNVEDAAEELDNV